jgi:hypothetical protein
MGTNNRSENGSGARVALCTRSSHSHTQNYGKIRTLFPMVTSPTMVTMVKQWIRQSNRLLHKYGFKCHTRMSQLAWLPNVTLHYPRLIGEGLHTPQKFERPPF